MLFMMRKSRGIRNPGTQEGPRDSSLLVSWLQDLFLLSCFPDLTFLRVFLRPCTSNLLPLGATLVCLCALLSNTAFSETDQEVAARQVALELAGAFSNDGFKLRDGHWAGTLAPNESTLIAVNLYAGNQYWFSAGATEKAKQVGVEVFDEAGAPLATEKYNAGAKAAAGLSVTKSGEYFVRVRLDEGEPAGVCFVYSYK